MAPKIRTRLVALFFYLRPKHEERKVKLALVIVATMALNSPPPLGVPDIKQTAIVSWYDLTGNKMANGKTFFGTDKRLAAHKDFPFGTQVKLTNPQNQKTLTVTITDRGPFVKGRDFDVSKAAAEFLGFIDDGVTELQYEVITQAGH